MPELPEVESIKLQLQRYLGGHTISDIDIRYQKCFTGEPKHLIGGQVKAVRRFGKALVIDFDNGYSMVIHIKMTGQLIYRGPKLKNPHKLSNKVNGGLGGKHTHVIFRLDKKGTLYYNDMRKFGWIKVVKTEEVGDIDFIRNLGDEFLDGLTPLKFSEIVKSTNRSIKTLLMDQKKIAGVGNIYANDALYLARIYPEKKANTLSDKEITQLYNAVEKVLKKGLAAGGASENAFVTPDGTEGNYQDHALVYGKAGEKCGNCGSMIEKRKVGGRGTYFCPTCQT